MRNLNLIYITFQSQWVCFFLHSRMLEDTHKLFEVNWTLITLCIKVVPFLSPNIFLLVCLPLTVYLSNFPMFLCYFNTQRGRSIPSLKLHAQEVWFKSWKMVNSIWAQFDHYFIYLSIYIYIYGPLYKFSIPYQLTCHSVPFICLQIYIFLFQISRMARLALRTWHGFDSDVGTEIYGPLLSQPVSRRIPRGVENRMRFNFKRFKKVFTHMRYIWKLSVCVCECECVATVGHLYVPKQSSLA